MIALLVMGLLLVTPPDGSGQMAQFQAAYAARRSDTPDSKPDPAISKAMDILIGAVRDGIEWNHGATQGQIDGWIKPFGDAIASPGEESAFTDEYRSLIAHVASNGCAHFVVVGMGSVTRTVAYDSHWQRIALPAGFAWNTPWNPKPRPLPCGLWLMDSDSIQAQGCRVGLRLEWLKIDGACAVKVGEFESQVLIDYSQAQVSGNRVTARTVDDPQTFFVSASTPMFERFTTWDCSRGKPKVVRVELKQQSLRVVDEAIYAAWHAKHPTALQQRIRKLWPELVMLDESSESHPTKGLTRITMNGEAVFDLKRMGSGYQVVAACGVKH